MTNCDLVSIRPICILGIGVNLSCLLLKILDTSNLGQELDHAFPWFVNFFENLEVILYSLTILVLIV